MNQSNFAEELRIAQQAVRQAAAVCRAVQSSITTESLDKKDKSPVTVADFATTVYHQMGIVADKELMAPGPRPIEIVDGGKVINDIIAKSA